MIGNICENSFPRPSNGTKLEFLRVTEISQRMGREFDLGFELLQVKVKFSKFRGRNFKTQDSYIVYVVKYIGNGSLDRSRSG